MTRPQKIGAVVLVAPFVLLAITLIGYAVSTFILLSSSVSGPVDPITGLGQATTGMAAAQIIKVILGLVGIIAVIGILPCLAIGIYLLSRKHVTPESLAALQAQPKYQHLSPEQIQYIEGWSWVAFLFTPVWAFANKLHVWGLGSFVPLVSLYVWIKLSIDGRKLAWEKGGWTSFDQFRKRQKIALGIGIGLIVLLMVVEALLFSTSASLDADTTLEYGRNLEINEILE